jgi:3-(3-hydroxy-phenyl)propionate hydroxylase
MNRTAAATAPFRAIADTLDTPPVLIVGAGPVGQTTALLLARWGIPVVLLDGRPERDNVGSKAMCQARDVIDIWDTIGAGRLLAEEGVTWTTAHTHYQGRQVADWSFVDRGRSPFPPFVNIGQHRTEAVLDQRIAAAGDLIEQRWGHLLTTVDQDENGVRLQFDTADGPVTLESPYAVIATGARSDGVRRQLGLSFDGETFADQFLICDIRADLPGWEGIRRFYFDPEWNPGRQVLIHACPDSVYRIDWQVPGDYNLADDEESGDLDRRIRHIIGDQPYEIVWKSQYRFHSRHTDRMQIDRVLLAGDAAHLVSPFGARGLNTGVFDAENAAWKIAFVLRGWAAPALLGSYDAERLAATRENIDVTSSTMRFLVPQNDQQRAERTQILVAAAADPALAQTVDSGRFAEPFWYVESPLTSPDPSRPFHGRPPRGQSPAPGPGIMVPDLPILVPQRPEITRLRQIAREGLLILTGEGVDVTRVTAAAKIACDAPVQVHAVVDIDVQGVVAATLGIQPGEAWIIRPDAHIAAVVTDPETQSDGFTSALHRALAT